MQQQPHWTLRADDSHYDVTHDSAAVKCVEQRRPVLTDEQEVNSGEHDCHEVKQVEARVCPALVTLVDELEEPGVAYTILGGREESQ